MMQLSVGVGYCAISELLPKYLIMGERKIAFLIIINDYNIEWVYLSNLSDCLIVFYGISTLVGYLIPIPFKYIRCVNTFCK